MECVGANKVKKHLSSLLDRVSCGESLIITRHGRPVARLVPVEHADRERARLAARRIVERRSRMKRVSLAELMDTRHEGHRF